MKYTREWKQTVTHWRRISLICNELTSLGWSIHTILPTMGVHCGNSGEMGDGAIIVAWKDEPDLTGGVPR